jgi:hypothetical protein
MKLNWGTSIALVMAAFMGFIIFLVFKTYQTKVDLVADDYYEQELRYQEKINRINNLQAVDAKDKVSWKVEESEIVFRFPAVLGSSEMPSGTIEFFRPSDAAKDIRRPIALDANRQQTVSKNLLSRGLYKIRIDWQNNGTAYYLEEDVYIQ